MAEASAAPRRRGRETALDMVRTMALIVAAVAVVLFLVPASPPIVQPGPDPVEAAAAAADQLGYTPAAVAPQRLGEGWRVSYARVETKGSLTQWRLGYLSPQQRRVDVEQAVAATVGWLLFENTLPQVVAAEPAVLDTVLPGRGGAMLVSVSGTPWWRFERGDGTVALARESGESVVVVSVTSTRPTEDAERVAAALDADGLGVGPGESRR